MALNKRYRANLSKSPQAKTNVAKRDD